MKILVAGASGALGRPLITQLRHAGHTVWGMAQSPRGVEVVGALGAGVVQGNALDRSAVFAIMEQVRPDCVVDQLTSLPASPFDLSQRLPADRVLRLQGGGNLFDAAQACGVKRYIQQSCGFYLDGAGALADDTAALKTTAPGHVGESARMYAALENRVIKTTDMQGIALRYGFFYGPHTWYDPEGAFTTHMRRGEVAIIGAGRSVFSFIHVEDAAAATVSALTAPKVFTMWWMTSQYGCRHGYQPMPGGLVLPRRGIWMSRPPCSNWGREVYIIRTSLMARATTRRGVFWALTRARSHGA